MGKSVWTKPFIALWCVMSFFLIAVVVIYCVIRVQVAKNADDAEHMCGTDAPTFDYFQSPPTQTMEVWVYNLSNPGEFVGGTANAKLHELGPYGYDLKILRDEIDFTGDSQIDFTLVNQITYNADKSCVGCGDVITDQVTVLNPGWAASIGTSRSEGNLLLGMTCSTQQIQNLYGPSGVGKSYCLKTDLSPNNNLADCKCCVPPGVLGAANNAYCKDLTNPLNSKAGLLGYMASFDGAYKLNSNVLPPPNGFPLSTGTYTPLVRTLSVAEILSGSMSALLGMMGTGAAITNNQTSTISSIATWNKDLKEVCYHEAFGFCPRLDHINSITKGLGTPTAKQAYLKTVNCTGRVPGYDALVAAGFSESRALELRYLEGINCKTFSPAIAFAGLINITASSSGTCIHAGDKMPCCLKSFSLGGSNGKGAGCVRWIDGLLQKRRVYNAEEARKYVGSTVSFKTVCSKDHDRLMLLEWFGQSRVKEWFTPNSYSYPNMPWADPIIITTANSIPTNLGVQTYVNITDGRVVTQTFGAGMGRSFLRKNLNNGGVKEEEFQVFIPGVNRLRIAQFQKNEYYDHLQTAKFIIKAQNSTPSAETQRRGEMPYPNMMNMVYTETAKPAILSLPNFVGVDARIFDQIDNSKRSYASGQGVDLYRTHESYDHRSAAIEPTLFAPSDRQKFSDDFLNSWNFEPATGLTVTNQAAAMFSLYTMNCNPVKDKYCGVKFTNTSGVLCYPTVISGSTYYSPCSNANVFTPKVQGEKVFPMFWSKVIAAPPSSVIDKALRMLQVRYAFSILCIIIPCLSFILVLVTVYLVITAGAAEASVSTGDKPAVAPSAPGAEREISLTGGAYDDKKV